MTWDALDDFGVFDFTDRGVTRPVYRKGEGPGIVVIHETPGITPDVARFARRLVDEGFSVWMPHLFGEPGRPMDPRYVAKTFGRICVSREFRVLSTRRSSPVTTWVRALCRRVHAVCEGPGVGVIGMCITGNFALSAMLEPAVIAPVLAQPSLPLPTSADRCAAPGASEEEWACVRRRTSKEGIDVLGLRFTADPACPKARFEAYRRELGERFEGIEIDSMPGNPAGIPPWAHSVLTTELIDEKGHPTRAALRRVITFFEDRLTPPDPHDEAP